MKKQGFVLLIVLMALSMLGIIGMQIFWLNNAYKIRRQEFDKQVTAALNSVVHNLEDRRVAGFIHHKMDSAGINFDSIVEIKKSLPQGKLQGEERIKVIRGRDGNRKNISIKMRTDSLAGKRNIITDDVIEKNDSAELHKIVYSNNYTESNEITDSVSNKVMTSRFSNVMNRMVVEWVESNVPLEKQFNKDTVNGLINLRLSDNGVHLPFEFALVSGAEKKPSLQSAGFNPAATALYSVSLLPSSVKPSSDKLLLTLSNQEGFLLKSMGWLLGISGAFTLIILLVFGGGVYFILAQKRMEDIRTDFINNMTHEFKTPIATINVAAGALHNEEVMKDRQKLMYYTTIIEQENKRMNVQVEQVLQMALMDRKQLTMKVENVNINDLVEGAVKNILPLVQLRGGVIHARLDAGNYIVKGDALHLAGVINNLLDNANKYSEGSPDIMITTRNTSKSIVISVNDKGIGMSKETQKKIFEKFYRVPSGNIHNQKGFGLGLSYVRSVVLAHGGTIGVESEQGRGSEFKISLPLI